MNKQQNPQMELGTWAIERLIPYAQKARSHSGVQIAQIAASIKQFGFNNPVLVGQEGDIIAGHGRVLAARQLSLTQVPVIILRHLTENQKRAFRLADNQLALNASWNFEMLRLGLEALAQEAFNLDLLGFSDEQLKEVLAHEVRTPGTDPDFVPEQQVETVSRVGDLWEVGKHRVLCGDGTQSGNLERILAGQPCILVFTDFPYSVNYTGKGPTRMKIINDNLGDQFGAFLQSACDAVVAVAQGAIYI